jgi:hypothetical protein
MNRGLMIMVPFAVAVGSYACYRMGHDKVERQAFEDAMFEQLVEERERERKEREQRETAAAAQVPKRRGFWG